MQANNYLSQTKTTSSAAVSTVPARTFISVLIAAAVWCALMPVSVGAASYEVAGWVPWFAETSAAARAQQHIDELDTIYPFVYEADFYGELNNRVDFDDEHWEDLFDEARDEGVKIIPTIAWFDGAGMQYVLANERRRDRHIAQIVDMVEAYDFDGVNIDYEGKLPWTVDHFSRFLSDLNDELGTRDLTCTLEARMPPEAKWRTIPERIYYSNDLGALNRHCDRIELMAYDQQRADIQLNSERRGVPYAPVADREWAQKVIEVALEEIDADKLLLGTATYGRAWDIRVSADWYRDYTNIASLNHPRIMELSEKYNAPVGRDAGGEAVISYFPEDSVWQLLNRLPTPEGTPRGYEAAAKALMVANYANIDVPVRFVTWSDAQAVQDKVDLVEAYDLAGIALFKVDGEEDEAIWDIF